MPRLSLLVALLSGMLVIGAGPVGPVAPDERPAAERDASKPPAPPKRILPDLSGTTLAGEPLALSSQLGKRLVIAFFRPGTPEATRLLEAVTPLSGLRAENNFEIIGVAAGMPTEELRTYVSNHGLDFPILDDADEKIVGYMRLKRPSGLIVTDQGRFVLLSKTKFASASEDTPRRIEGQLRELLRLPKTIHPAPSKLLELPAAPEFSAKLLDGDEVTLASLRGKRVALTFFIHNCPYCQSALETLRDEIAKLPKDRRPEVLGIEISGQDSKILESLESEKLDFFRVAVDSDWSLRNAFGVFGDVPVIFMIDAEGRIVYRTQAGWDASRDPGIVATWLARLADVEIPMHLSERGFTGNDTCGACHAEAYAAWKVTTHATAFGTLIAHGDQAKEECVGCHVVGFGEPGGFALITQSSAPPPSDFEGVGCESCHGRGGPHLSPDFVTENDYEPVCQGCHDSKHSIGFDYGTFSPRVSHTRIAAMTPDELEARIAENGQLRNVLPTGVDFVGSDACKSCHASEFDTWAAGPHARSIASLSAKGEDRNADCQRCHTTGFSRPGGFPSGAAPKSHADLARVGCESCHGPGADHVGENANRIGTIVSLTDKCDTCAILKVCGACHDEANDPGFGFDVDAHIERQRHGTITPFAEREAPK